jgi:hypothetical protein
MTAMTSNLPERAVSARKLKVIKTIDKVGLAISILTILCALVWAFPLYWAVITSLKPESQVVEPGFAPWPRTFTVDAYTAVLFNTKIGLWYFNSIAISLLTTVIVVLMWLCHQPAQIPRPQGLVVRHSRQLHGAYSGPDREPLHPRCAVQAHQHMGGHHHALAHRPHVGDDLQAVLRWRS